MKKKIIIISLLVLVIIGIFGINSLLNKTTTYKNIQKEDVDKAYQLLHGSLFERNKKHRFYDEMRDKSITYVPREFYSFLAESNTEERYGYTKGPIKELGYRDTANYQVNVTEAGYYEIEVDYFVLGTPLTNFNIKVSVNGQYQYSETEHIDVPLYWEDETKDFPLDSYGDETLPQSKQVSAWRTLKMFDNEYSTSLPLLFYFESDGTQDIEITLVSSNGKLALGDLAVKAPTHIKEYSEYVNGIPQISSEKYFQSINAISYSQKNSSYIRMANLNKALAKPYHNKKRLLNIIDGGSWNKAGQELSYTVDIEEDGLYNLAFHYRNAKEEYSIFRTIYLDGVVPFQELLHYEFPATGSEYRNEVLHGENGEAYNFYLTKGTHTLTFRASASALTENQTKLQLVIDHVNQLALEVLKITGNEIDKNRTWDILRYIPEAEAYLLAYDTLLKDVVNEASKYSNKGAASASLAYIQRAIKMLQDVIKNSKKLPLYLSRLTGRSSINQLLGDTISSLSLQPLTLEAIYISANNAKLPKANTNFFVNIKNSIVQLGETFFSSKYSQKLDDKNINVWVSRPVTHINVLQKMIDSDFNQKSDVKVKLSAMPDASKLTLAIAAGNAPDIAMGIASHTPFDLAMRNGLYDLSQFDDFYEVAANFAPGTMLSFLISDDDGDRFYGIPESLNFNAVAYREDIFNMLDINNNINTWDDLIPVLSILQQYGMNFYMPISQDNSTKWFYQTIPLILQAGGKIYHENGLSVALTEPEAVAGQELLIKLFTDRALPKTVPLFYSQFRNGSLPVGVIDFASYLQLKNAAPEINGKWKMMPPIGTERKNSDGETYIDRTYISSGSAASILKDAKHKQSCWEFLKWWTSKDVQTQYGYILQSTYGPEYLWLSSNINAIHDSQIDQVDKEIILDSIEWITDVVRNPAQYMVERNLSNTWTSTVLHGSPIRVTIENNTIAMNREIIRKMKEFGYLDSEGNVIKKFYIRDIEWMKERLQQNGGKV